MLPQGATSYYRRATLAQVQTFPNGLRMIAGDAAATSPQDRRVTFWSCGAASGMRPSQTVPTCPARRGSFLRLHVRFPSCWDGRRLDSPDHMSHMAYARAGRCPSTHAVPVSAITQICRYRTRGGEGFSLASGGQFSAVHLDGLETDIVASITVSGDAPCKATDVAYRMDTESARSFLADYVSLP